MKKTLLALCLSVAFAAPVFATQTPTTTLPPTRVDTEVTCSNVNTGAPVSLSAACTAAPRAEADAACAALANGGDADALAICGSLNFNSANQVCAPFVRNNIKSICAPEVDADADAYCGTYLSNKVDTEVYNRCGDARQVCEGDHNFLAVALKLGEVSARCKQAQEQSQKQSLSCVDSSVNSFDASQSCEQAVQTVNTSLSCPDIQAVCAKEVKKNRIVKQLNPLTGKKEKVWQTTTKCVKWARPVVTFSNP